MVVMCGALATVPADAGTPVTASPVAAESPLPTGPVLAAATTAALAAGAPERAPQVVPADAPDQTAIIPPLGAGNAAASPSQNVTINLINRLVERGILTRKDSEDLIQQAEEDASFARMQASMTQHDAAVAREAARAALSQVAPPATGDAVRVTYIPEVVKTQMRDEIRQQVMAQARAENWAAPRTMPEWVSRFKFLADVRVRYEGMTFPDGNDNTGAFPNFNAINTGGSFDVSGNLFSPQYNVDETRNRFRLRARFGIEADLTEGFTAGLRIGTGESNSPVSQNQSFGVANQGQGGNFSKYAIWLDRGFIRYELGDQPSKKLTINIGRFDNPFFSPSQIVWDDELGFDGIALDVKYEVAEGVTPFLIGGAFPVFNTDLNFSSNQPTKFESNDKYLYSGQLGLNWKITPELNFKISGAYYYFQNIEGKRSDPYTPLNSSDAGNTDNSRPSFAQTGNTYRPLRNIVPTADNNFGTTNQYQYFGLATPFRELVINGKLDYTHFEPVVISLSGEWVKNLAYEYGDINAVAVNNRGPDTTLGGAGSFDGGDSAWIVNLSAGTAALEKRWDWNAYVNYRYVESDAVVDGFADSDFGGSLPGTNHKGYTIGGSLALAARVWLGLRWMSSTEIAGPPFRNDVIQFDINAKF